MSCFHQHHISHFRFNKSYKYTMALPTFRLTKSLTHISVVSIQYQIAAFCFQLQPALGHFTNKAI